MRLNWFGDIEHRVFNYKPRCEQAGQDEGKTDVYVPGSLIQGSFRNGNYAKRKSSSGKFSKLISILGMVLFFVILIMIAKFFQLI